MKLYIAEKQSLAEKILKALTGRDEDLKGKGSVNLPNGDIITWVSGHMYELFNPDEYDSELKRWKKETLPIIPDKFKIKPTPQKERQLNIVKGLLKKSSSAVNCGDAGREGQLLIDELLEDQIYSNHVERAWFLDMSDSGIKVSLDNLKDNSLYQKYTLAAQARSYSDWLIGFNLTRLFTLLLPSKKMGDVKSVGRVRTPVMNIVVMRDLEIENFIPKDFYEIYATFNNTFDGKWKADEDLLTPDGYMIDKNLADSIKDKVKGQDAEIISVDKSTQKTKPPLPYILGELQRDCSKEFGFTLRRTMEIAQELYDKYSMTTYPRAEDYYLSDEQYGEAPDLLTKATTMMGREDLLEYVDWTLKHKVYDMKRLDEHHAIIPTGEDQYKKLPEDHKKVYDMIVKRYLAVFFPDKITEKVKIETLVEEETFITNKAFVSNPGFTLIYGKESEENNLPAIEKGSILKTNKAVVKSKKTSSPKRFTEGTLVDAMMNITRYMPGISDEDKEILKSTTGIGTSATRDTLVEELKRIKLLLIKGQNILSSETARELAEQLPDIVKDPVMTAKWEAGLRDIEKERMSFDDFMVYSKDVVRYVVSEYIDLIPETRPDGDDTPSEKQIKLATKINEILSLDLSDETLASRKGLSEFIDKNYKKASAILSKPSEAQLKFANGIAEKLGIELKDNVLNNSKKISEFINKNKDKAAKVKSTKIPDNGGVKKPFEIKGDANPPSEKQINYAKKLSEDNNIDLPEGFEGDWRICSNFISKTLGK